MTPPSPPATASPAPSPFLRLADVEVQLVMQQLDIHARLHFARCSRQMRTCALQPFAWQAGPMRALSSYSLFPLDSDTTRCATHAKRVASCLLRLVPVLAVWELGHGALFSQGACVRALARVPNLRGIRFVGWGHQWSRSEWLDLLAHPLAQQLLEIDCHQQCPSLDIDIIQQLTTLPSIRRLGICPPQVPIGERPPADFFSSLVDAPSLTHLLCNFFRTPTDQPMAALYDSISRCSGLRRLSLESPKFQTGELRSLFAGPHPQLHNLQYLSLKHVVHVGVPQAKLGVPLPPEVASEYVAAFRALPRLHTLRVDGFSTDSLLEHVAAANMQALVLLEIQNAQFDPTMASVRGFLEATAGAPQPPRLHFSFARLSFPPSHLATLLQRFRTWRGELLACSSRVTVSPFADPEQRTSDDTATVTESTGSDSDTPQRTAPTAFSHDDALRRISRDGQFIATHT